MRSSNLAINRTLKSKHKVQIQFGNFVKTTRYCWLCSLFFYLTILSVSLIIQRRILEWQSIMNKKECGRGGNVWVSLDCFTLEDGTDRLSRNVGNYQSTPRNIPKERISHLHSRVRMFRCNWPELAEENLYIRHGSRCPGQDSNRAPMKSERYCFQHLVPDKGNYFNLVFFLTNASPY